MAVLIPILVTMRDVSRSTDDLRSEVLRRINMASYSETVTRAADGKPVLVVTTQNSGESGTDWYNRHLDNCRRAINGSAP